MTMLTNIQKLRNFGIFDQYDRPTGMQDFCDRNIIYGWNYSGKTTLSRLLHLLHQKAIPPELSGCSFTICEDNGGTITHENLAECTLPVRVFNADFVSESLNWNGGAFRPILLLGEDAIDAQQKIEHFERVMARCANSASARRREAQSIDDRLSEAKTAAAKQVKTTLALVEAFTAIHLDKQIKEVAVLDNQNHVLSSDRLASDLSLANASEKDRLPVVSEIAFSSNAAAVQARAAVLLSQRPPSSEVLEILKQEPPLAAWVSDGLALHRETDTCAFCLNPLTEDRRRALEGHFSREMADHKVALQEVLVQLNELAFDPPQVRESDLNVQFRARLSPILAVIHDAATRYTTWIDHISRLVSEKVADQFAVFEELETPDGYVNALASAIADLNELIRDSNALTRNFSVEKAAAVQRLKYHYAYQFTVDFKTDEVTAKKASRLVQASRFEKAREQAETRLNEQRARINRAQNGREKINERIGSLLNSKAIQIDVVAENGADHFVLKRHGRIARNLSEGEKTAIAFAFFLTKLLEEPKLQDVIVFIDDPISSLDSNHIFQVYSILKTSFFKRTANSKDHATACKQLFVSTHNFEFFSLLRDLPGEARYFMTKRISPTRSTLVNLPPAVSQYPSEYHYLFHLLHSFYEAIDKSDAEHLLALPNAARRFLELYTYAKLPLGRKSKVEARATQLFGAEKANRILKILHHFSHLESVERLMTNTNAVADIEGAVSQLMECIKEDKEHYSALIAAIK